MASHQLRWYKNFLRSVQNGDSQAAKEALEEGYTQWYNDDDHFSAANAILTLLQDEIETIATVVIEGAEGSEAFIAEVVQEVTNLAHGIQLDGDGVAYGDALMDTIYTFMADS